MNKLVLSILVVAVIAIALGTAGFVSAQAPTPQTPVPGTGYGMGGGRGARGGMMNQTIVAGDQDGILHDAMMAVYAQKLGVTVEDLEARLAKGETMAQIATSKGLTADQFYALMADARSQAIAQAVKNGTLTQAQADWMNQRGGGQMMGNAQGMRGGQGMRGAGQGRNADPACPYYQTNP
jgi:hypothetical protein